MVGALVPGSRRGVGGQLHEMIAGQSVADPFVHGFGSRRPIEAQGGLIPFEDGPVDAPVSGLSGDGGKAPDQGPADPTGPITGPHEEILERDARASRPGGEAEEPDGHADDGSMLLGHVGEDGG